MLPIRRLPHFKGGEIKSSTFRNHGPSVHARILNGIKEGNLFNLLNFDVGIFNDPLGDLMNATVPRSVI